MRDKHACCDILPFRAREHCHPLSALCHLHPTQACRNSYSTHTPVAGCLSYFAKPHSCVRVWLHKTRLFPPPHIFMVPLGPRLVFKTSCRPLAAEMFTCSAWAALATSAFGLSDLTADMSKGTRGFYACALEN